MNAKITEQAPILMFQKARILKDESISIKKLPLSFESELWLLLPQKLQLEHWHFPYHQELASAAIKENGISLKDYGCSNIKIQFTIKIEGSKNIPKVSVLVLQLLMTQIVAVPLFE